MKTLREFAIKTKLDKIGFLPGDIIHGDLYLYFEQPSEIQAVEIFFYGIGSGAWLEQFDMEVEQKLKLIDSVHPQPPHTTKQKRKLVDIGLLLYGFAEPRNNKAIVHEQGRYVYEFEINIPEKIPCTFKSPSQKDLGYSRYYLKAVMSRPKKRVKVTKIPIVINELLDPDRPDLAFLPGSFQEKNLRTACLPTGSLSLECHLSKSHYIQGERILIQALAQNCSPKVLKEMYAKLVRRVRCKSSFGTNTFTSNEASIHGTKIPAQTTIEWKKEELRVPAVGPTIAGNREIRIDYMVRIGMYEELGCEVHLDLPVVIGTVGLPDRKDGKESRKESESKSKPARKDKPKPNLNQLEDTTAAATTTTTATTTSNSHDDEQHVQIILTSEAPEKSGQNQPAPTDSTVSKKKHSVEHYDAAIGIQNALNDIDQDVSRIKRRISQAKESVSRSFDLDFEFDKIATDRITSGEPQPLQFEPTVLRNEAWEGAPVTAGQNEEEKISDIEDKKSRKRSSVSSKCSQNTVVEVTNNNAVEKRNYTEIAAKALSEISQASGDQKLAPAFDIIPSVTINKQEESLLSEKTSSKTTAKDKPCNETADENVFPLIWTDNKSKKEDETNKTYATPQKCNQQVQFNGSDTNKTYPTTYSDVYLSNGIDTASKKSRNTYAIKEDKQKDSRNVTNDKKGDGHCSAEEQSKKDDSLSKKSELQHPVVTAQTEFHQPQSWTNVFEKYGGNDLKQTPDSMPPESNLKGSIQIPAKDSAPCFEGYNEKKTLEATKQQHPAKALPTEDFKTFAYYVERERKELDERVQRYLQDGGKNKSSYRMNARRRNSEESSRGYYDRMNKSMDAIREISSSCSDEFPAAQHHDNDRNNNNNSSNNNNNNNESYHREYGDAQNNQVKRPLSNVRNQRRLSGRTNIHRRNSTESMSSDDQVLIDYRGLTKPFSDLTTSLDRRVLKYLKEKEDLTKEYTDATTASSTTPVSSAGSAPPPVSTTPASSSSSAGRSSSSPFTMDVKSSQVENNSPHVLPATTEESEVETAGDQLKLKESEVLLPQNISEETAKIFLELLDFATDDSGGCQGNQYFEDVTYKFLKCLQADAKGRKIEYKGGFLDTIRKAKADIMAVESERIEDLKTLITSTVLNVNNKLETTFDHFDNNFENMRQRIIENFKCDASKKRVSLFDIKELEDYLASFVETFDYIRDKHLASMKSEELVNKLGTGDFEEQFRKFKCDLHHLRNIFVSSLKDGTGCIPNNTIDAIKIIFFEFDTNLENGRRKLIEGLKKTLQRIDGQLYKCASSFGKQSRSRLNSVASDSQQSDMADELTYLRGNITDVNKVIIKYFLTDQPSNEEATSRERGNNLIKEIEEMGYNVTLSDDNKLQVTESTPDIDVRRPSDGLIMDEEISRSLCHAFSKERDTKLNEAKQLLDSDMTDHDTVLTPSKEMSASPTIKNDDKKEMCIVMEVESPLPTEEEPKEGADRGEEGVEIESDQISHDAEKKEFDEAFFPVFDEPDNTQNTLGAGAKKDSSYVPVPYEPLVEDATDAQSPTTDTNKNQYETKKSFQVHLKCKSDSEESHAGAKDRYQGAVTSTTPFSSEESDFNKSPEQQRCDEQLEQFDHVFEALRQNFLECLKSEQRVKSKRDSGRQEDLEEDFQVFNKLDEDFEEIRQTFIESLKKDKNSAIDSIEQSLCKFDDNFDEIRQKFLSSLKDENENAPDTTFTDLEASIDRFDDDFEELRQKFMDSLRKETTDQGTAEESTKHFDENDDDFEKLRQKFMLSLKKQEESVHHLANDLNRTYTKITSSKMNTTYTKVSEASKSQATLAEEGKSETEKMNESYVSPCLSKTMSTDTHHAKEKAPAKKPGPDQQSRDEVSWLDLNALGQFGPEEFSAGDSRCILPSCGEIVILQEPKGMPQFTKYSYSPQHIKKLKGAKPTKLKAEEGGVGKTGQKGQSKIKTKLKSRGKFMSDVHIVTDEPKHMEPTGPANRSWLDLNAIGQLGPEEEISGDNQFLLPTGKEVIILGEGGKMTDSDHLAQLSNLRRKSSGKCNEFRRRGSKEKEIEAQRKLSGSRVKDSLELNNNSRVNVLTPPPRTTSLRATEPGDDNQWKRVVLSPDRSQDESRSVFTPYDLPEEEEIATPPSRSDLPTFEEIISSIENAIGGKLEEKSEQRKSAESPPLVQNDVGKTPSTPSGETCVLQQPLPPVPSRESSFYVDAREMSVEMDIEEIFIEEARGNSLIQVNEEEFEVISTPPGDDNKDNDETKLPVINLVVEAEESNKTDSFNVEMIKERKKSPGLDTEREDLHRFNESDIHGKYPELQNGVVSPVKINKDAGDSKDVLGLEDDASDSFIHRATSYMKTFFRFSYSDNEKSDNEKLPKEDNAVEEMKNAMQQGERNVNEKPPPKHPVDMDATDNFIEDLPSLVSDKTDTSEVGTTENSSLLRGPRKLGPEERYNYSEGEGLYNEIPMFIERMDIPKRKSITSDKEMSEFSEDLKSSNKLDGVDLDATENLIEDIYLVTDEPDSSEAKSLPTASSRASNKVDRHYSTDERRLLGNRLHQDVDLAYFDEESGKEQSGINEEPDWVEEAQQPDDTALDNNLTPMKNLEIADETPSEEGPQLIEDEREPVVDNSHGKRQPILEDTDDEEITNQEKICTDPRYLGIPKSKHIGPEEVCSVEEKSLLALDKDIFVQVENICEEVEDEKEGERICVKSSSDSGVNEDTGNFVRAEEGELHLNEATSFKPGPEEWITSKEVILSSDIETSENDAKTESLQEISVESDIALKKLSSEKCFKRSDSGGEVVSVKDRSDSSNGTYDIVSNRDTLLQDSADDIRHARKCLYGQISPGSNASKDSSQSSPSRKALPELEPISFDVTLDYKKHNEEERSLSEKDSEIEHSPKSGPFGHMEGLEELKMLHCKTYSGTDSGTDQNEAAIGEPVSTFTPRKGENQTCTILNSADEDGSLSKLFASAQFSQAMKNQTQNKRPPTGKRKRKVRDRRVTGSSNDEKNPDAVEKALAEPPLDLQVSLVRGKKSDEDQDTDVQKPQETKQVTASKTNIKRKEWKLDFGGNIRPTPVKDRKGQRGFENLMFGVPDSPGRKGTKLTGKKDGLSPKAKKKLMSNYAGAVRERMNAKEKKNRALKVINLTVEKDQEFKKLTKAIKKKLILKSNEEKQLSNLKSKAKKDAAVKRKSFNKKDDKGDLASIAKKSSTKNEVESIENQLVKDAEKKKRRNSSGKLSTSSSEDIGTMSHMSRLESESNKRNQVSSKEKPPSKPKTSVGSEKGRKKKGSTESMLSTDEGHKSRSSNDDNLSRRTIELSVDHEESASFHTPTGRTGETDMKGRRKVRRSDKTHGIRDVEIDSLMSTMLTSSFRSRAASKLSSPDSDNHTDSGDNNKVEEIEYEIDWEILKRGVKGDHDSSSSYFTAEEVSKPSSSDSSGSTPRELLNEQPVISLKMVPDSSEAPEATSPEILSDCNTGKLFFAGKFPGSGTNHNKKEEGYGKPEDAVDLMFSWDSTPRPSKQQHQQQQPIILVERSSSDRDSGITSSGEETSKSQLSALENNLKQNFMERSIYKLQSISEEDKETDNDTILSQSREGKKAYPFANNDHISEKETLMTVGRVEAYKNLSSEENEDLPLTKNALKTDPNIVEEMHCTHGEETVHGEETLENVPEEKDKTVQPTNSTDVNQEEISAEELMLEETIAFLQRPPIPIESCMSSLDIKHLTNNSPKKQINLEDAINFSGELITFDCDDEDLDEDEDLRLNSKLEEELSCLEEVGVYEDKKNISENLPLYLNKEKKDSQKDEDAILKDKLNQFFADTCMKQDFDDHFIRAPKVKAISPPLPLTNEEEIFRKEFERLREFERLEEAFQEGKASGIPRDSHLIPLKSEDEYVESSLSSDVISVTTDVIVDPTSDAFFPRAPMTPITEESASSIEDAKSSECKKAKDDNCQLFKPSKVGGDISVVVHKSPVKKKGGKSPKRMKKPKKGGKKGEGGDNENIPVATTDGGKVNKRYNSSKTKGDKVKTNKAAKLRKSVQLVKSNSNTSTNSEQEHYYDRFKMRATKSLLSDLTTAQTNQTQEKIPQSDDMESATDGTIIAEHTDIDVELVVDDGLDIECMIDGEVLPDHVPQVSDMLDTTVHPEFEHIPTKERVESVIKQVDNCVFRDTATLSDDRTRGGVTVSQSSQATLDTGLEIIVTDISSNADDKEESRRRRSSSSSSIKKHLEEKEKEQEVNRKVMKVIKLFTEAINKKEIEEGASSPDNCFSQQIMNSIFNAAQQSAYFEEESTADIIKALEAEEACRDLEVRVELAEETLGIGTPYVGTAVQQYKQSMTGGSKPRTSPSPRQTPDKLKTKMGRAGGTTKVLPQTCGSDARQSRSVKSPTTYNVNYLRHKYDDDGASDSGTNKPNISSRFLAKKNKQGNKDAAKKTNPRTPAPTVPQQQQSNIQTNTQEQTSMKNTSTRKPARGEYVSPYRQQLKKSNKTSQQGRQKQHKDERQHEKQPQFQQQLEEEQKKQQMQQQQLIEQQEHQGLEAQEKEKQLQPDELVDDQNEKEDEYQEIEVDVKIKVTPIEDEQLSTPENENNMRRKSSTESSRSKSAEPRRERPKSRNNSLTRIGRTDAKKLPSKIPKADEARSSSADRRRVHQSCFQETSATRDTKMPRDWSSDSGKNERLRRSSSELQPKVTQQKKQPGREKRRSSNNEASNSKDKSKTDGKTLQRIDSLEVDTKNSKGEEREKKSPRYSNDLASVSRGPVFPYIGYIESKNADSPPSVLKASKTRQLPETGNSQPCQNTVPEESKESLDPLKMISSSKASDTCPRSSMVQQGGKFDSSFAIIHSMSNEFNCEDMCCKGERKQASMMSLRAHADAPLSLQNDVLLELDETSPKTGTSEVKTDDNNSNRSWLKGGGAGSRRMEEEGKRGRRCRSVTDESNLRQRKQERKSRSLESNGRSEGKVPSASPPITRDYGSNSGGGGRKVTGSKIYHTLPATTGGANLFVESRGAILPYIGHIERLDVEISKTETETKQASPITSGSESGTNKQKLDDEKSKIPHGTDSVNAVDAECPSATVRSSTPNNVALEVKIPIPAELSSSLEHSDSQTLTFNIDVSLDSSEFDGEKNEKKSTSTRKSKKRERRKNKLSSVKSLRRESETEQLSRMQEDTLEKKTTASFDNTGGGNSTNTVFADSLNGPFFDEDHKDILDLPRRTSEQDISAVAQDVVSRSPAQVDSAKISEESEDSSKKVKNDDVTDHENVFLVGGEAGSPNNVASTEPQKKLSLPSPVKDAERIIYPYNHFISPFSPDRCNNNSNTTANERRESKEKNSRKSWPLNSYSKSFEGTSKEPASNYSSSFNVHSASEREDEPTSPASSCRKMSEERVCLGGGLVFSAPKKISPSSRHLRRQTSPRSGRTTKRKSDTRKITKSSSMPSRSAAGYTSRCNGINSTENNDRLNNVNRRIPAAYGLTTASMPSYYRTPPSNLPAASTSRRSPKQRDPRLGAGLNEEKVNNLVCDIKDAGATISDILDEMQALKMFLNEEEGANRRLHDNMMAPEASLLMASNDALFPWQRGAATSMATSSINTSWDFQDSNAGGSLLTNINGDKRKECKNNGMEEPLAAASKPSPPVRTESFKNKLKEELARTISATLQEIHPYSNRVDDNKSNEQQEQQQQQQKQQQQQHQQPQPQLSYTSASPSRIPSMDDALREIRISAEDMDPEIVTTTIQLYNVTYSPELPTYTHSREGHSACTYMHSSLDKTEGNCGPPVPSVFDIKPNTEGRENPLSTETKYTTLLPPEINACVKVNRPPPKSYVRPLIFNKMLTGNPPSEGKPLDDEQSLDSGLYNTNSTDDSHVMQTDLSLLSKGTRESFEQHEISLGIVDEFGRLRRNSDLVKDRSSDGVSAIASDKEKSERELDCSLSRIEIPERERTFVKSENTTIEEHVEDVEVEVEVEVEDDIVSVDGTYVMSQCEHTDAGPSSCDEDGFPMDDDVRRNTNSPTHPPKADEQNTPYQQQQHKQQQHQQEQVQKDQQQHYQQQQHQSPGKSSVCVLSPDINRYDSTAPGIPHGSFSYEEEIIETYNYVGKSPKHRQQQQQQQQQIDVSATSTKQDNVNICYKSSTNYYPIEIDTKSKEMDADEKEDIDQLFKDRDLDDVINSIRLALGSGPERADLSRDFDDDSISKTRSHDCTDEMVSPISLEMSKHNKNCL